MEQKIGELSTYIVNRKTDIGYILNPIKDNDTEIFLHFNQAIKELEVNDTVKAFLYYDNKRRLCATLEEPLITTSKFGFISVVSVLNNTGCFMNIGIVKDILLSKDYLPNYVKAWPMKEDKLPCILKVKKDSLVCKILSREDLPKGELKHKVGEKVNAVVTQFTSTGLLAISEEFELIYIHKSLTRKSYRIGEAIECTIININQHNEYNGSLILQKEHMIDKDKEMLLRLLNNFGGVLCLGNLSSADEIQKELNISKSAFKRAVGSLYKDRLITIDDYKITKVDKDN